MRKRKQYQIETFKLKDFNKDGKTLNTGTPTGLAENQVVELIQSLVGRRYIEDDFNYIPEMVFLDIDKVKTETQKSKLRTLIESGLYVNGRKYRRFVRSTSMVRNSKIAFIDEKLLEQLESLVSLGKFNEFEEVIISKFEGYMGLSFSTTLFVHAAPQNVCVVDDSIFDTIINTKVKGIRDGELIEGFHDVPVNLFDGMGLHSPEWGEKVAKTLNLENTPVGYQIRLLPGFKGMSYEIDFKEFYKLNGVTTIQDKWGVEWDVEKLDCIWSTSMFKLHNYFESWKEYISLREKYYSPLGQNLIGVSSYSDLSTEPKVTKTTYQYLQVLSLTRDEIVELAQYTKDTIERVYRGDLGATMVYLSMIANSNEFDEDGEEDISEEVLETRMLANKISIALGCNPEMINDPYVSQFIQRQLKKSINDAKLGRIWVDGRYSYIAQDPLLMLEIIAGLEPKGCLEENEFYSSGESGLRATFRSPLTHSSEVGKLNFISNDLTDKWLCKYKNIIVLNGKDITAQAHSGSDFDGDKYFITKNPLIIDRVITRFKSVDEKLNITYKENLPVVDIDEQRNRGLVKKEKRNLQTLIEFDLRSLDNLIGRITNVSTYITTYAMTHNKLLKRDYDLVLLRLLQGQEIDFSKHGVRTLEIPEKYEDIRKYKPYFLQKYKYGRDGYFQGNVNTAPLNILCKNIENWEKRVFIWEDWTKRTVDTSDFLMDEEVLNENKDETKRVKVELEIIYQDFRTGISKLRLTEFKNDDERKNAFGQFYDDYYFKAKKITKNQVLLSSLAVYLSYIELKRDGETTSFQFPWVVSWEGLTRTLSKNQVKVKQIPVMVPFESLLPEDTFEFLGKYYTLKGVEVELDPEEFIENEYENIVNRELKRQIKDFELELVLVGFNDKSVDEVTRELAKKTLRLGVKEHNGKNYATIEGKNGYIASVKHTNTKHLIEDGLVDLTRYRGNKVKVEVLESSKGSVGVKLQLVG